MVLYDCLIKTKHFAKIKIQCIECELCQMPAGYSILLGLQGQEMIESPVNGGLNHEGPKVAKCLGR